MAAAEDAVREATGTQQTPSCTTEEDLASLHHGRPPPQEDVLIKLETN